MGGGGGEGMGAGEDAQTLEDEDRGIRGGRGGGVHNNLNRFCVGAGGPEAGLLFGVFTFSK
jgi:hypothetical protein